MFAKLFGKKAEAAVQKFSGRPWRRFSCGWDAYE